MVLKHLTEHKRMKAKKMNKMVHNCRKHRFATAEEKREMGGKERMGEKTEERGRKGEELNMY